MTTLQLSVCKEHFDQMKAGNKPFEYRLRKEYWRKRLVDRHYDTLIITWGYPEKSDMSRRMVMPYCGYEEHTITHPHFGDKLVEVFAIKLTNPTGTPY